MISNKDKPWEVIKMSRKTFLLNIEWNDSHYAKYDMPY